MTRAILWAGAVALAAFGAVPATADWLVFRGGGLQQTQGPWTAKGSLVLFTGSNRTLYSAKADEIDLAASRFLSEHLKPEGREARLPSSPPALTAPVSAPLPGACEAATVAQVVDGDTLRLSVAAACTLCVSLASTLPRRSTRLNPPRCWAPPPPRFTKSLVLGKGVRARRSRAACS